MLQKTKQSVVQLLRWSERHTKTDMVYLAKGGAWLTFGQAWAAGSAFILSLIVARYLSAELYGSYRYIASVAAIVGAFSLTGLGIALTNAVARGFEGTLQKSFRASLGWNIPAALVLVSIGSYYAWNGNIVFAAAFGIAAIATPLINSGALYAAFLGGRKDFGQQAKYWMAGNGFTVASLIATILYTDNLIALVAAYFVSTAFANTVCYLLVRRAAATTEADTGSLRLAAHLSLIGLLNTITANIDRILVFQLLGPVQLAVYTFANAIPEQVRALMKTGARLALPKFSERPFTEIQQSIFRKVIRFGILAILGSLVYIVAAPFLYAFLFPAYEASIPYSQVMALSLVFALGTVPLAALQAHAKTPLLYQHSIITNLAQIASTVILIGLWGLWGAVASLVLNRAIAFALSLYLVARARE